MFNNKILVKEYIKEVENRKYNNYLLEIFRENIAKGAKVLELGSGIGIDYVNLRNDYDVTVSEYSKIFIEEFEKKQGFAPLEVDARDFKFSRKFDAIYASKVFPFIKYNEIGDAVMSLSRNLNPEGKIFLSFWYGDNEEQIVVDEFEEVVEFTLTNYNEKLLKEYFAEYFELEFIKYNEIGQDGKEFDSIILIGKLK